MLDAFASDWCLDVAAGVPVEMQCGEVNEDGWVAWRLLPSRVEDGDLAVLEAALSVTFPTELKAFLLARTHLFDQVRSPRHDQLICTISMPSNCPLGPFCELVDAWSPLLAARFLPIALWGDGWGPMCLDIGGSDDTDEDASVVWFDGEVLGPLGAEAVSNRAIVLPYAQPLYSGFREFLEDVFFDSP